MVLCIMKYVHHKPEKKSVEKGEGFVAQTLAWRIGKRLRKIVCQDLLSHNYSVILLPVVQQDCLFRPKFTC
jgi:hypothetical protein